MARAGRSGDRGAPEGVYHAQRARFHVSSESGLPYLRCAFGDFVSGVGLDFWFGLTPSIAPPMKI